MFYSWQLSRRMVFTFTYKDNWSLQPFSQDYDLASHTTYVVCGNFIHEWRMLEFKVDSEWQIFAKFLMVIYLLLELLPKTCRRRNIFSYFSFWCPKHITHYLPDYGNYHASGNINIRHYFSFFEIQLWKLQVIRSG